MINLLPSEIKQEIFYSRRNRTLGYWIIAIILVSAGIGVMTVFGQLFINRNVHDLQSTAKITQSRISSQNLASTQKDIQTLSNNFKTVTQLLGKQLLFSKLFVKIGSIIPTGAILNDITLSNSDSSIDINIAAINRASATQAFVNISDPKNGLFDKADLVSVNCVEKTASSSVTESKYPCTTVIKVVMKADSSYYFLNSITAGAKKS